MAPTTTTTTLAASTLASTAATASLITRTTATTTATNGGEVVRVASNDPTSNIYHYQGRQNEQYCVTFPEYIPFQQNPTIYKKERYDLGGADVIEEIINVAFGDKSDNNVDDDNSNDNPKCELFVAENHPCKFYIVLTNPKYTKMGIYRTNYVLSRGYLALRHHDPKQKNKNYDSPNTFPPRNDTRWLQLHSNNSGNGNDDGNKNKKKICSYTTFKKHWAAYASEIFTLKSKKEEEREIASNIIPWRMASNAFEHAASEYEQQQQQMMQGNTAIMELRAELYSRLSGLQQKEKQGQGEVQVVPSPGSNNVTNGIVSDVMQNNSSRRRGSNTAFGQQELRTMCMQEQQRQQLTHSGLSIQQRQQQQQHAMQLVLPNVAAAATNSHLEPNGSLGAMDNIYHQQRQQQQYVTMTQGGIGLQNLLSLLQFREQQQTDVQRLLVEPFHHLDYQGETMLDGLGQSRNSNSSPIDVNMTMNDMDSSSKTNDMDSSSQNNHTSGGGVDDAAATDSANLQTSTSEQDDNDDDDDNCSKARKLCRKKNGVPIPSFVFAIGDDNHCNSDDDDDSIQSNISMPIDMSNVEKRRQIRRARHYANLKNDDSSDDSSSGDSINCYNIAESFAKIHSRRIAEFKKLGIDLEAKKKLPKVSNYKLYEIGTKIRDPDFYWEDGHIYAINEEDQIYVVRYDNGWHQEYRFGSKQIDILVESVSVPRGLVHPYLLKHCFCREEHLNFWYEG